MAVEDKAFEAFWEEWRKLPVNRWVNARNAQRIKQAMLEAWKAGHRKGIGYVAPMGPEIW